MADIPVYLVAGFLDAGKTNFINGILEDGFARQDPTLLICCEEGEEAYEKNALDNVTVVTVEDEEDLKCSYLKELEFATDKTVLVCGPPIMIKFVLAALGEMGFEKTQVYTTLELRMKCGVGKCGRCNIGSKYVCKDGPVFRCDEIDELPPEY